MKLCFKLGIRNSEEEVDEVYFVGLLFGGGVLLEEGRDTQGIAEGVKALGLLDDSSPFAKGFTLRVGIGEDDDLVIDQRRQHLGREHLKTTTGQPETVGEVLGADDGCLLALYHTDGGPRGFATEQVLTEKTAVKDIVGRKLVLQEGVNPCGVVRLDAVTVGLIVHHLTGADALLFINLPKDDTTIAGDAEQVLLGGMAQLLVTQIT